MVAFVGQRWQEDSEFAYTFPEVSCRTQDGLRIHMQVVFSFNLGLDSLAEVDKDGRVPASQAQTIVNFYLNFGTEEWVDFVRTVAISAIQDEAAHHMASAFYEERSYIGSRLYDRLRSNLREAFVDVMDVNMLSVDFPARFTAAIMETELAKQKKVKAAFDRDRQIIMAETRTRIAEVLKQTLNYTAYKTGHAYLLQKEIMSEILEKSVTIKGDAFDGARASFRTTGELYTNDDLLNFVWLKRTQTAARRSCCSSLLFPRRS